MSIELTLQATKALPRVMVLTLTATGKTLSARVLAPENRTTLCYCIGSISNDWSLRVRDRALWCRGIALDLSEEDVAKIRKTLGPHGLVIEADSLTAAPIGPESAKVGARTITPPGARGTSPLPVCTGRGALESEASVLAYALTNGECF